MRFIIRFSKNKFNVAKVSPKSTFLNPSNCNSLEYCMPCTSTKYYRGWGKNVLRISCYRKIEFVMQHTVVSI